MNKSQNRPIKLWDPQTYPPKVTAFLCHNADVLFNYFACEKEQLKSPQKSSIQNRYLKSYERILGTDLPRILAEESVHVFHYTRLFEEEKREILTNGFSIACEDTLRWRLERAVKAGHLKRADMHHILENSRLLCPAESDQRGGRLFACSEPVQASEEGAKWLLHQWGGEAVFAGNIDLELEEKLKTIGSASVVECIFPIAEISCPSIACVAVLCASSKNAPPNPIGSAFSVDIRSCLPAKNVFQIYTEGTKEFAGMFGATHVI